MRGALGNGVESFLVVVGDTMPAVEHMAHHYEIVEHLRELKDQMPDFEVGMPTRFRHWQYRRRIELGAEFFVAGPVLDPATIPENLERLRREPSDPPLYLMVIPPFSPEWVDQMEKVGAVPAGDRLRETLAEASPDTRRKLAWQTAREAAEAAAEEGCAGIVLMGLNFDTLVGEAVGALGGSG